MFMMSIVPIIVLFVVYLLFIGIGMRISRSSKFSGTIKRWLFPAYAVILVTAFVISFFLPLEQGSDAASDRTFEKEKVPDLYMASALDNLESEIVDYKIDEWKFKTDEDQLNLFIEGEEGLGNIVAERKQVSDGVVEAKLYVTPYVIKGIDMTTELIPETHMNIQGRKLTVDTPKAKPSNIDVFQQAFTIRQFTEAHWFDDFTEDLSFGSSYESGNVSEDDPWIEEEDGRLYNTELLYIKIPADMSLESIGDVTIRMVEQEAEE